jgi:predicted nucleic acid-binding protein
VCRDPRDAHRPPDVPELVVTEVVHIIERWWGLHAQVRFLGDLAVGNLLAEPAAARDWLRVAKLVAIHRDLPLGAVDASVVATAARLGIERVATQDQPHFAVD